jgi:RHS repeat-associated protein
VGVTGPFGTVTWEYDAFSRRVKQHDTAPAGPEIVRDLIWEGLSIIESRNQATGEIRRYYGNGEERELAAAVTRLFYTTDHLGSIRELTDATGTIRARYDYDPYGNVTKLSGNLDTDFAYTGHYYHAASGLHLAPYRGYDPRLGRWLSRDPIGEVGGINLYGYVGNGPISNLDLLGLFDSKDALSNGVGFAPGLGTAQSIVELCAGKDYITGEPVNRWFAAVTVVASLNPGGKAAVKAGKFVTKCEKGVAKAAVKGTEKAAERTAIDMAKQIERDIGKKGRRAFHDADHLTDRTIDELKADAAALYEAAGKAIPNWMK